MIQPGQSNFVQHPALTDALTGVGNRRRFDEQFAAVWRASENSGMPFSVLLFDIDFFKAFADRFGRDAADECLRRIAEASRSALRESADFITRYGNEEFAVILPVTDETIAAEVAERLRRTIMQLALPNPASTVAPVMTISLGVVTATPDRSPSTPAALLESAELMLYQAQISGHNRSWTISDFKAPGIAQSLAA